MQAAKDAVPLDNTELGIEDSVSTVLGWWNRATGFNAS
jgi:cytidylate kinase